MIREEPSQSIEIALLPSTVITIGIVAHASIAVNTDKILPITKYHDCAALGRDPATMKHEKIPNGAKPK